MKDFLRLITDQAQVIEPSEWPGIRSILDKRSGCFSLKAHFKEDLLFFLSPDEVALRAAQHQRHLLDPAQMVKDSQQNHSFFIYRDNLYVVPD